MSERGPGRPREHGEGDWLTVQEAADRLGVTYQAIHKRIQRGTIEYDEWIEEGESRPHLRVPLSAVEGHVGARELDLRNAERTERIEGVLLEQFGQILKNQEEMKVLVNEAVEQMRQQAQTEKAYQKDMLDLSQRVAAKLEEPEPPRGFWSRIFRPE
jgi:excisionase family DNA binding protein